MEAVILAGGMGTRLRSVVADVPNCMASVAGKPFLEYLVDSLQNAGFDHIILSLGYKHEAVEEWVEAQRSEGAKEQMRISFVVESEPLGTGGAVKFALQKASENEVFILNGDTFLDLDYAAMLAFHRQSGATATLALKKMQNFERYGRVEIDNQNRIVRFAEKQHCIEGLINAGVYVINRDVLTALPEKFSIEKDFFEKNVETGSLSGFQTDGYFIDIGIPEDYEKAQKDFSTLPFRTFAPSRLRAFPALFLDRDGVINVHRPNDYVKSVEEFEFIDGAKEALKILAPHFRYICIVTNQRGVGKGLMTERQLAAIHSYMCDEITKSGGRIDKIYVCTATDDADPMRKPNPGMALQAKQD
ncbi:MAG: HAD-IIIA family hydrolase, partial [Dysgonamonadaceae bacterium]|nr:HAD-IIIA family hydrolase [Dysgonamonadaceae bacterium]